MRDSQVKDFEAQLDGVEFDIPLKGDVSQRSGLNASFGRGRVNKQGFILWHPVGDGGFTEGDVEADLLEQFTAAPDAGRLDRRAHV